MTLNDRLVALGRVFLRVGKVLQHLIFVVDAEAWFLGVTAVGLVLFLLYLVITNLPGITLGMVIAITFILVCVKKARRADDKRKQEF